MGWLLLVFFALTVAGELIARFHLGLGNPPVSIADPEVEYFLKPDQEGSRFGNRFFINHYGMRSNDFSPTRAENELRIMVFGDSVLNGGNPTDQADLATSILQQDLSTLTSKNVVVGNVSAGSWGPGNWLAYARKFGFFDANAVVLVISSHDYADNPSFEPLNPDTHPTERPFSALTEGISRYLPRLILKQQARKSHHQIEPTPEQVAKGLADLREFLELARDRTGSVLVLQHWEKVELDRGEPNAGNQRISSLCESMDIPHEQLGPHFTKAMEDGLDPFRDNIHPNPTGQRLIASAALEALAKGPLSQFARASPSSHANQ